MLRWFSSSWTSDYVATPEPEWGGQGTFVMGRWEPTYPTYHGHGGSHISWSWSLEVVGPGGN